MKPVLTDEKGRYLATALSFVFVDLIPRTPSVHRYVFLNAYGWLMCSLERSGQIEHGYESSEAYRNNRSFRKGVNTQTIGSMLPNIGTILIYELALYDIKIKNNEVKGD